MLRVSALIAFLASSVAAQADPCTDESAAYKAATDYVMFQLKYPFSSVFPEFGAEYTSVENTGDCTFAVSGFVDAKNSLGRIVRHGISLDIEYLEADKSWSASGLVFR